MNELLKLTLVGIGSVVALFIIAKLLGKRQIAQLDFADYVIGISIGSIAAEMSTDVGDRPFYYYLIAIAIYFLFDLIINCLGRTSPVLKHLLKGKPIIIIYEGQINYKNLKKSKQNLDEDEFINVYPCTTTELSEMIYKGEIQDSKTIAAIMAYICKYER